MTDRPTPARRTGGPDLPGDGSGGDPGGHHRPRLPRRTLTRAGVDDADLAMVMWAACRGQMRLSDGSIVVLLSWRTVGPKARYMRLGRRFTVDKSTFAGPHGAVEVDGVTHLAAAATWPTPTMLVADAPPQDPS